MMKLVVLAVAVAAVLAAERPQIADEFIAETEVERATREETIYGEGFLAHDQTGRKAAERYDLRPSKFHVLHVLNLQRADLRKEYALSSEDPHDCHERDFSGTLHSPFAWVANATFAGAIKHHEVTLDAWEYRVGGVRLALGVAPDNVNIPVVFERESADSLERFYFHNFTAEVPESKFFEVPQECNHQTLSGFKAPERPRIPETFVAATDVERQDHHETTFGEGRFAHDQPAQKAVELFDLHPSHDKDIRVLNLQRGDLHEEYAINSEDPKDCHKRNMTSPVYPPFAWVAQADYVGTVKHHEVVLDAWEYHAGGSRLLVGVTPSDTKTPVIFERESGGELTRIHFLNFTGTTPEDKDFEVPEECQS
eukprot:m.37464 g.37464  ORF g.37464 m.37464 type:complete len:367 (-) comp12505_c0_seq1:88-1188(-)